MKNSIRTHLKRFHENQSGAIALLVLAAMMVVLMLSLVVMDAGQAARDKLEVQQAADTAAWSEAAVEARAMNMIAFANVAKRVTIGMTSFYEALWLSYIELGVTALALAILTCATSYITGLVTLCEKLIEFCVEIGEIMADEASDGGTMASELNGGYFKDDVIALNNYQTYMSELAPWWAFSEGLQRGMRNGALVTASFPVPENGINGALSNLNVDLSLLGIDVSGTGIHASLPVAQSSGSDATDLMCERVDSDVDYIIHGGDYLLKSAAQIDSIKATLIYAATLALALGQLEEVCPDQMDIYGEAGSPWRIPEYASASQWLLHSSNLTFAFKPSQERMGAARDRYDFLGEDYEYAEFDGSLVYGGSGYWAMARSEVSFQYQDSAPNLWYPSWTARMRPVAVPGEWAGLGDDITLGRAMNDVLPAMAVAGTIQTLTSGDVDFATLGLDLARAYLSTHAFNNERMEGLAK